MVAKKVDGGSGPTEASVGTPEKAPLPRVPLPKIRVELLENIYGDFREVIEKKISKPGADGDVSAEYSRFFEYLLSNIDAAKYQSIQERFLDPSVVDPNSDVVKYLDPVIWFQSKVRLCLTLGLDKTPPQRILDLGTGPGHFPFVARFYGHEVVGTDLPARTGGIDDGRGHLYDALCDLYQVRRIPHRIYAMTPLGDLGGRYDTVTAFLAAFNVDDKGRPWTVDQWRYFLNDLQTNVLAEHGTLFMTLADGKLTEDSWAYLKSLSDWSVDKSKQIILRKPANL